MKSKSLIPHSVLLGMIFLPGTLIAASAIQFQAANFEANEGQEGEALIRVTCTPPPLAPVTALIIRTGGIAERGDFSAGNTAWWTDGLRVSFTGTGQSEVALGLHLADDGIPESDETVSFALVHISGDAVAGPLTNAVLTIHNNYPRISGGRQPVADEGEPIRYDLHRLGDTNVPISVDFSTADGTARAGLDYFATTGTVTFAAGQLANRIQVTTLDNGRCDGLRDFQIRLSNPSIGVSVMNDTVVAYISDNEQSVTWDRNFRLQIPRDAGYLQAVTPTANGKFLVSHRLEESEVSQVVRLNSDGSADSSFAPAVLSPSGAQRVVLDSAGRCLVLGSFEVVNNQPRPGIARLLSNGVLDDTFQPPPSLAVYSGSPRIAFQPDGRLLFLNFVNEQKLVRLNADGSLDSTFHAAAETTDAQHLVVTANTQAVTSVGFSVITTNQPLVRLEPNGDLDMSFHRAQFVAHPNRTLEIVDLVQQPLGKLLAVGSFQSVDGYPRPNLARLNADGTVDTNFSPTPGTELADPTMRLFSTVVDSRNRVLLVGEFGRLNGQNAGFDPRIGLQYGSLARLNSDGTLDPTFEPVGGSTVMQFAPEARGLYPDAAFWGGRITAVQALHDGNLLSVGSVDGNQTCHTFACGDSLVGYGFVARMYSERPTNSFEFSTFRFVAKAGDKGATITVRRLGNSENSASVNFATSDGSALAGRDYLPTAGTLRFAPLELSKTFTVSLVNDRPLDHDLALALTLSSPVGVEVISGVQARLTIAAPFGFRAISRQGGASKLTIFGSPDATYVLEVARAIGSWNQDWWVAWRFDWLRAGSVTLTNREQIITNIFHDDGQTEEAFYRLRRLAY